MGARFLLGIQDIILVNVSVGEWFIEIPQTEHVPNVQLSLWLLQFAFTTRLLPLSGLGARRSDLLSQAAKFSLNLAK